MLDVACHCTHSRRVSRSLTEVYDRALRPSGLTVSQYALLRTIGRLGSPTIGALAEATGLDRTTLGRNLRVMGRSDWVALEAGEDARTRVARQTPDGKAVLERAVPLWEHAQAEVEQTLPPRLRDALREASELLAS